MLALQHSPFADGNELPPKTKTKHHTPIPDDSYISNAQKRKKYRRVWMKCIRTSRQEQSAMANGGSLTILSLL